MSRHALLLRCLLAASVMFACSESPDDDFTRDAAPPTKGIHGYAHACVTMEAYDNGKTVRYLSFDGATSRFAFSAADKAGGTPLRLAPSTLATYLLYAPDRGYVVAKSEGEGEAARWHLAAPKKLASKLDTLDSSFKSPAEWELEVSSSDAKRYRFKHYATGRFLSLNADGAVDLSDDEAQAATISFHAAEGCAEFPEMSIDAEGLPEARSWPDGDLWGVAEIHSHIFSDAGFGGGGLFHGAPFHRLGVERALPNCSRAHGEEGKRDVMGYFYDGDVAFDLTSVLPILSKGQLEDFNHATDGYPTFSEWPNPRKRSTHQAMYYRWIERAWRGGLRLIVQHATGNSVMCDLTVSLGAQKTLYACNDMVSVDHAIDQAYELERYIDAQSGGPGKGWLRIVKSPKQAREVIAQGKMALVLGIEISNTLDCFLTPPKGFPTCDETLVKKKLDHYKARGVRVIFPVHKYDNAFSAGDGSRGIIAVGNLINSGHYSSFVQDCPGISTTFDKGQVEFGGINKPRPDYDSKPPNDFSGFATDIIGTLSPLVGDLTAGGLKGQWCQKHGLTPLGKTLLQEMMVRGLIPDVAHLPQRSLVEAFEILEKADFPALKTHGNSNDGRIYGLGGLVSERPKRCGDPKKPGGVMSYYAKQVALAKSKGAYPSEAISFDLNGFAGSPGPRFGPDSGCKNQVNPITYPFTSFGGKVTFSQPHLGKRKVDFNTEGMIHIGLLPELIEDARHDGVTDKQLEPLFRSAEAYVRMWEKAEARAVALSK